MKRHTRHKTINSLDSLDRDNPFAFFRLDVEPIDMLLDIRLGTSGGGGFLLLTGGAYAGDVWGLYEFDELMTFGRM